MRNVTELNEEVEASTRLGDGTQMELDGKLCLVVPVAHQGNVVSCCVFRNIGKLTTVWVPINGKRLIMELAQ